MKRPTSLNRLTLTVPKGIEVMKGILMASIFSGLLSLSPAQADSQWFFGVGGALVSFDDTSNSEDETGNIYLRSGMAWNKRVEVGIEFSTTLSEDRSGRSDIEIDTTLIFIKGNIIRESGYKVFIIGGASNVKRTDRGFSRDDNDFSFGIGAQFNFSDDSAFEIEHMTYYSGSRFDTFNNQTRVEALKFGYVGYF